MVRVTRRWAWHYVMQFVSGRKSSRLPVTKHALLEGEQVSLCNRRPYWRLQPAEQQWLNDPAVLSTLTACTDCEIKISKLGDK